MTTYLTSSFTNLVPGGSALATDVYAAVDTTDLTQSNAGSLKKYTISQLQTSIINSFTGSNLQTAYASTVGNLNAFYLNGTSGVGATLTNSGALATFQTDGVTPPVESIILVQNQTSTLENGIYILTNPGSGVVPWVLTRNTNFDGSADGKITQGDFIGVLFGTDNALSWWFLTSNSNPIVGTDPITFQRQTNIANDNWVVQTTASVTMAINTGYTSSAGAILVSFALPLFAPVGSWVEINGEGSGLFRVTQAAGQIIHSGSISTTLGVTGELDSLITYTSVKLRCIVADTTWELVSYNGSYALL